MERLSIAIKDNKDKNEIIRLTVGELKSTLTQRAGAQAIKFVTTFCFYSNDALMTSSLACLKSNAPN